MISFTQDFVVKGSVLIEKYKEKKDTVLITEDYENETNPVVSIEDIEVDQLYRIKHIFGRTNEVFISQITIVESLEELNDWFN